MLINEYGRTAFNRRQQPELRHVPHVADSRVARAVARNQRLNIMPIPAAHAETCL